MSSPGQIILEALEVSKRLNVSLSEALIAVQAAKTEKLTVLIEELLERQSSNFPTSSPGSDKYQGYQQRARDLMDF